MKADRASAVQGLIPSGMITEVLVEPGQHQLWVTFEMRETHRIDLRPLTLDDTHRTLTLGRLFERVKIGRSAQHLSWPGGACLDARSILDAPHGTLPIIRIAVLPSEQRYRPLLPFLLHQQPPSYLRPLPIEPVMVERLFQLKPGELGVMLQSVNAPHEVVLPRLHDLAIFLTEHFAPEHLYGLLHRPWRYGQQQCPNQTFMHTMLGCLLHGRPDLIERPCLLLMSGGAG